jgi:quinol monooxygenase YgiN
MRPLLRLALGLFILSATFVGPAHAQSLAMYVVTYVDVMPNAAAGGAALLGSYRDSSRKEDGSLRFDALQEIARPNRFAILEVWKDKAAYDAHAEAASTAQFHTQIKALQNAPPDERFNSGLYVQLAKGGDHVNAIYVVTHVDVVPTAKDDCLALLKAMSVDTPGDPGNIAYDVLQQTNRANHFTVFEAWASRDALDAHAAAPHTRAFREQLTPMAGALYDERFYTALE